MNKAPIGVFDSGYGGLTILKEIKNLLPEYDFIYLGDNARTPYGPRSFDTVYEFTLQSVKWLFSKGCPLIILACNTASAKALRTIQQTYLSGYDAEKRVLGVIRPTAEVLGTYSSSKKIGILGTKGTINSESYVIEIGKFFPEIKIVQHACPMWVPLVENNEYNSEGADYFIKKDIDVLLNESPGIDTILLACTHYPLLLEKINKHLLFKKEHFKSDNYQVMPVDGDTNRGVPPWAVSPPPINNLTKITVISQGNIVAKSLQDYLKRHPEMETRCSKNSELNFFTTDSTSDFDQHSQIFFGKKVSSQHVDL